MVLIVTALSGYQRVLMPVLHYDTEVSQIWRQAWRQAALYPFRLLRTGRPTGCERRNPGCVSISVTMVSPLWQAGQMTRLHCPNR